MFTSRKYTPLPTSSNPPRKRAGGGMAAWKRYSIVGGAALLLIVGLGGWHSGYGRKGGDAASWDNESELTVDIASSYTARVES